MATDGRYDSMPKKEIAKAEKEKRKLVKNLEGIRHMGRLPDALFVIDTRKEQIAVDEARKLKIPVIGIVDTNCDPDQVDYVIPGNDDALRAIQTYCDLVSNAVLDGLQAEMAASGVDVGAQAEAPAEAVAVEGEAAAAGAAEAGEGEKAKKPVVKKAAKKKREKVAAS
jgi:small subunit ribosomal protein S2